MRDRRTSLPGRRPELDGLRGLAALAVLLFHVRLYTLDRPAATALTDGAGFVFSQFRLGLVLFFVLSGYLLYGPWVRAALDGGPAPRLARHVTRRASRVLPAYYLALAGAIVLLWGSATTPGVRLPEGGELWTFGFLLQNYFDGPLMTLDPPMWTLVVEVSFYAALPFVGWAALRLSPTRFAQAAAPLVLIAAGLVYNAWLADLAPGSSLTLNKILPAMLPYFGVGMLAAVLGHGRRVGRGAAAALVVAGALALWFDVHWRAGAEHTVTAHVLRDLVAAAGFAAVVGAVACPALARWVGARPLAALGTASYGLYLWHVPLILWLRSEGLLPSGVVPALAIVLPLSLSFAAASWLLVERPALALERRASRSRRLSPLLSPTG
jgi:peptidoglycan/LPS O-acetylase OafA/YrhL